MQNTEIKSLTGLRGIAAMLVMAYHYSVVDFGESARPSPVGPGYLAVDFFFVLSGFVMAMTYADMFRGRFRWQRFGKFLSRRFARIYPLYLFITIATFAIAGDQTAHVRSLIANALLVQDWGIGVVRPYLSESLITPAWSISTEAFAYLIFPLLTSLVVFRSSKVAIATGLLCASVVLALSLCPASLTQEPSSRGPLDVSLGTTLWPLGRCVAEFTIGLLVWRVSKSVCFARTVSIDVALVVAFTTLWLIPHADVFVVGLFAAAVLVLSADTSPLARIFGLPPFHRLGEWSYAIYLLHWPAVHARPVVELVIPSPISLWVLGALVVTGAAFLFRFVELPSRKWLRSVLEPTSLTSGLAEPAAP